MVNKIFSLFGNKITNTPLFTLLLIVGILRIPSLFEPYWYGDEGIYLTLGEGVRHGLVLYKDLFDHKPPLLYWVAALAGSVFWFRLILLTWHLMTISLFHNLSKKLFGSNEKLNLFATAFFALFTTIPLLEGHIANAELFMIGTTIAAFNLLITTDNLTTKKNILGGLFLSLSFLFKVPSVFDFLVIPFFWFVWEFSLKNIKSNIKNTLILGLSFAFPIAITFLYYATRGALADYLNTALFFNSSYIASWETYSAIQKPSFISGLLSGGFVTRSLLISIVAVALFIFRKFFDKTTFLATIWFSFSAFAMLLSGRPYPHYILQVIPPLSLLVTILFFGKQAVRFLSVPLLTLFIYSLVFYKFYTYPTFSYYKNFISLLTKQITVEEYRAYFGNHVNRTYKLANYIVPKTTTDDRIFIWGTLPELYALSNRLPAVKFTTSFHIKDLRAENVVIQKLTITRPKYIIKLPDTKEKLPGLNEFLSTDYFYVEEIEGAQIWKAIKPEIQNHLN